MKSSLARENALPETMLDQDFDEISRLILDMTGISIDESKRPMIFSRFSRRLRELGLNNFSEYIHTLKSGNRLEVEAFINTVTTNLTYFFREPHHFDYLRDIAIPELVKRNQHSHQLRIWSSACSSGQEAYSIAMTLASHPDLQSWTNRVLATDIDTAMVSQCESGIYSTDSLRGLEPELQRSWLSKTEDNRWLINEELRKMVLSKPLNLFSDWPFRNDVDVIFCRNAFIYFDEPHQNQIIEKFAEFQTSGAFLFLGHSESIKGSNSNYKRVSNTVYQRN